MPNWKEAFEQVLAKGCVVACTPANCMFCVVANKARLPGNEPCSICPLHWDGLRDCGGPWGELGGSLRHAICRHVLVTVKDFTDRDEIRARIAEMLDDDAQEKFVGKAEPIGFTKWELVNPYERKPGMNGPPLNYAIVTGDTSGDCDGKGHDIIIATRDKDLRDRVLAFLNDEAK